MIGIQFSLFYSPKGVDTEKGGIVHNGHHSRRKDQFCLPLVLPHYLACQQRHQEARLFPHVPGSCPPYSVHPSDCPLRVANCQMLHLCHLPLKAESRESLPSIKKDDLSMPLLSNAHSFLSFARAWLQVFSLRQSLAKREAPICIGWFKHSVPSTWTTLEFPVQRRPGKGRTNAQTSNSACCKFPKIISRLSLVWCGNVLTNCCIAMVVTVQSQNLSEERKRLRWFLVSGCLVHICLCPWLGWNLMAAEACIRGKHFIHHSQKTSEKTTEEGQG